MNVSDSQIAAKVLSNHNYKIVDKLKDAEIVLLMTCSIREGAETKVFDRLKELKRHKNKGRLKHTILSGRSYCLVYIVLKLNFKLFTRLYGN